MSETPATDPDSSPQEPSLPVSELQQMPAPYNPRGEMEPAQLAALRSSLRMFGAVQTCVVNTRSGNIVGGHQRVTAAALEGWDEFPVRFVDLSEHDEKLLNLALNRIVGRWDDEKLHAILAELRDGGADLGLTGFEDEELQRLLAGHLAGTGVDTGPVVLLADRFLVPPFTVLNARAGYWQRRKVQWLRLGMRGDSDQVFESVRGRSPTGVANVTGRSSVMNKLSGRLAADVNRQQVTSIFDPVLAELAYRWFSRPGARVLDPFAGGSVRGIVAAKLGRAYVGVDLSADQVAENERQAGLLLGGGCEPLVQGPALEPITDPLALTPVQELPFEDGMAWIKRDDLFDFNGARGSKARAAAELLRGAKGATTAGNRWSPMAARVARVAEGLAMPCRCHMAGSRELTSEEQDAVAHSAELIKHKVNYLTALCSKARVDAEERGWVYVPLGVESDLYVEQTRKQAENLPAAAERVVVTVGSGMAAAALLCGLADCGREELPVLGVQVGMDPEPQLDRYAPGWRDRLEIVKASSDFREPAHRHRWWGIALDPHYEAKAAPFVQAGDVFWNVACSAVVAAEA